MNVTKNEPLHSSCKFKQKDGGIVAHGKQRVDIHQEIKQTLRSKERFGESKYAAKRSGTQKDGIYIYSTAHVYNRECQKFAEYVREVSPKGRYTSLEEAKSYARDYIARENADMSKSAYTVKLERSALAKLYGVDARTLGSVRERSRNDITRSRERTVISEKTGKEIKNQSTRAGRFSEKNHEREVAFARGTGMRRSEMEQVRGDQLHQKADGSYYFRLEGYQCKGGRERELPVIGDAELIKEMCQDAGHGKVFEKIPAHMDVHHYRSEYASSLYKSLAREREDIPKNERYCCRDDLKGVWYDKAAMKEVSEALGHSRISVIAEHYLR